MSLSRFELRTSGPGVTCTVLRTIGYLCVPMSRLTYPLSNQCDQFKIAKCLQKLPTYDFTRKIQEFDTCTKIAKNVGDFGKLIVAKGFEKLPKVQ